MELSSATGWWEAGEGATIVDFLFVGAQVKEHSNVERNIFYLHSHKHTLSGALQFSQFVSLFQNKNFISYMVILCLFSCIVDSYLLLLRHDRIKIKECFEVILSVGVVNSFQKFKMSQKVLIVSKLIL